MQRQFSGERIVFSTNDVGTMAQSDLKRKQISCCKPHTLYKDYFIMYHRFKHKPKTRDKQRRKHYVMTRQRVLKYNTKIPIHKRKHVLI